jgi:hypothetical protein
VTEATDDAFVAVEGAEIEVRKSQRNIVARFTNAGNASAAFTQGHKFAQQGLDLLSVLGKQDAVIHDAEDEHVLWWSEEGGLVLRVVSTTVLKLAVGRVTLIVRDKDGHVVPQTPVRPRHHIAFRYYRLAQTTDDLFDAYRNMYLAFEAFLSSQYPMAKGEQEITWLRRALGAAAVAIRLDDLGVGSQGNLVESVLDAVYRDARLPLFHAKEGRDHFPPQDSIDDRMMVSRSLGVLTRIVLRMAEVWSDARRVGGGVFLGWVYRNMRDQLADCSVLANNHAGPFDPGERDLSHARFQSAVKLAVRVAPELERGREPALFATARGSELASVQPIRRLEVVTGEYPLIAQLLDAELECDGVDRFEMLMHIRGMNVNQPRSLFRR